MTLDPCASTSFLMRALGRNAVARVTRRLPLAIQAPSSTRLGLSRTASTTLPITTCGHISSFAAIAGTATFSSTSSTAASRGAADGSGDDLNFFERKTLDARSFFLEGMLRDPTPNLSQLCQTMSELSAKPYARAAMLRDDVCGKFTRSFIAVSSAAEPPSAETYAMACNTLSSLDVGSTSTSVLDDASGKEFFENVAGCASLYALIFRSPADLSSPYYLADAQAVVASCDGLLQLTADDSPAGLGMRKWIAEDYIESNVTEWAAAASAAHPTGPAAEAAKQVEARFAEL